MNSHARTARATLRQRTRNNRAAHRAAHALATGSPQPVSTHLIGRGLDPALAKRFAGAVSKAAGPAATATTTRIKLRGRRTKTVAVKLFPAHRIAEVLLTYRPKSPLYAPHFERLALAA